jgi:adenylosuccinate lyase
MYFFSRFFNLFLSLKPNDRFVEFFNLVAMACKILQGLSQDIWTYISRGVFKLKIQSKSEVGSSTMPHKNNPIDFENAEGNFNHGANALLAFNNELLTSRMQRDLSESSIKRTMGSALTHAFLGCESLRVGLSKLEINPTTMTRELSSHWEVLGEPIQTCGRLHGIPDSYDKMKQLTRGVDVVTKEAIGDIVELSSLPEETKRTLFDLRPDTYLGYAKILADIRKVPQTNFAWFCPLDPAFAEKERKRWKSYP